MNGPQIVVAGGTMLLDFSICLQKLPVLGSTVLESGVTRQLEQPFFGGNSSNVAVAAARAGAAVSLIAVMSDDKEGADYRTQLEQLGIGTNTLILATGQKTPHCYMFYDGAGEKHGYMDPIWDDSMGSHVPVPALFDTSIIDEAELVVLVGGGMSDPMRKVLHTVADHARAKGSRVFISLTGVGDEIDFDLIRKCSVFFCNSHEAGVISQRLDLQAAGDLAEKLDLCLFVTNGAEGATIYAPGTGPVHVPASIPAKIVDPTGAGDAFAGVASVALASGHINAEAARAGAVVSSFVIEERGAQSRFPLSDEFTSRHLASYGEKAPNLKLTNARG